MSVEAVDGADASGRELERGAAVAHTGSGRSLKELKQVPRRPLQRPLSKPSPRPDTCVHPQVNWSSEVSSVLNGRQPDEGDPLLREYFGVHDLYTKQLEVRLASERTRDEGTYLRLLAIEGEGEEELERAVELLAAELPPQVASPSHSHSLHSPSSSSTSSSRGSTTFGSSSFSRPTPAHLRLSLVLNGCGACTMAYSRAR
jgi:hypothetical protein